MLMEAEDPPYSRILQRTRSGRYADTSSMDALKQKLQSRWATSLFFDEAALIQDLTALKQFSEEFAKYRVQIEQAPNPSKKLLTLYQLDKSFGNVEQDLVATLMQFFRERVESHFSPVPSVEDLKAYFKRVEQVGSTILDSPLPTRRTLEDGRVATTSVNGFAGMLAFPTDTTWSSEELAWLNENRANVDKQVGATWCKDGDALFHSKNAHKTNCRPLMLWYGHTLGQAACGGRYKFFNRIAFLMHHDPDVKLHWSVLGWNVEKLLALNMLDSKDCVVPDVETMMLFETLGSEVMGTFASDLAQLQGILEGQQALVQGVKNKILAGLMSLGFAAANVVSDRITKAWNDGMD